MPSRNTLTTVIRTTTVLLSTALMCFAVPAAAQANVHHDARHKHISAGAGDPYARNVASNAGF